jgi:ribosome biogenesis GTPase
MTFEALGWSCQRQADFAVRAAAGLIPGRVVGEHRSHFRVATEAVELSAEITGRLRNAAVQRSDLAGVGDFVALRLATGDHRGSAAADERSGSQGLGRRSAATAGG